MPVRPIFSAPPQLDRTSAQDRYESNSTFFPQHPVIYDLEAHISIRGGVEFADAAFRAEQFYFLYRKVYNLSATFCHEGRVTPTSQMLLRCFTPYSAPQNAIYCVVCVFGMS